MFILDKTGKKLVSVEQTTFSAEGLKEQQDIEEWIWKNPNIFYEDEKEAILIIGKQKSSATGKRSDLLAIDKIGNIVVIEIKRDIAQAMTEFQAILYASNLLELNLQDIYKIYSEHLEAYKEKFNHHENANFNVEAKERLNDFLGISYEDESYEDDFKFDQRIILVAGDFSKDLLSACSWLILKGIKIECIKLEAYKKENEIIIIPKRILPVPVVTDFLVSVKIQQEASKRILKRKYQRISVDIQEHYNRLEKTISELLEKLVKNIRITPSKLFGRGFYLVKDDKEIRIITTTQKKVEFNFLKAKKSQIQDCLDDIGLKKLIVKPRSDIEPITKEKPTPSIDCSKKEEFESIKRLCVEWLDI